MNESKDISSGDRSRHARDVVKRYVEMNYQLGRGLWDLIEAEAEYEVDKAFREERCLSIANECLTLKWVPGARESWIAYEPDHLCSEIIEKVEMQSDTLAFVFTHDPGPPDLRWRYEVVQEDKGWRIARLFKIEFNGKPWDYEFVL
jgi:hypothetical protein